MISWDPLQNRHARRLKLHCSGNVPSCEHDIIIWAHKSSTSRPAQGAGGSSTSRHEQDGRRRAAARGRVPLLTPIHDHALSLYTQWPARTQEARLHYTSTHLDQKLHVAPGMALDTCRAARHPCLQSQWGRACKHWSMLCAAKHADWVVEGTPRCTSAP